MMLPQTQNEDSERRGFFKKICALVIGGVLGLFPLGAGLAVFFDPLRRKTRNGGALRVAALEALPPDGAPRKFAVIASRTDAWNKFPRVPIGAVYLRRTGPETVEAFNVVCPHAGCFVDFLPEQNSYLCPCHNSTFTLDGKISDPASPAPRGLDSLRVELRQAAKGTEIWVHFQNFHTGQAEKVAEA